MSDTPPILLTQIAFLVFGWISLVAFLFGSDADVDVWISSIGLFVTVITLPVFDVIVNHNDLRRLEGCMSSGKYNDPDKLRILEIHLDRAERRSHVTYQRKRVKLLKRNLEALKQL